MLGDLSCAVDARPADRGDEAQYNDICRGHQELLRAVTMDGGNVEDRVENNVRNRSQAPFPGGRPGGARSRR